MPQVASDPVVQRPLRPEPASGRAGAPGSEPSGSFETLLDTPAAGTRPARAERAAHARASGRDDRARPADHRTEPRTETRRARDSSAELKAADENPTKSADTPDAPLAKTDQPSDASLPAVNATEATRENTPIPAELFAVVAEAVTVELEIDTAPAAMAHGVAVVTPDQAPDQETDVAAAPEAAAPDVAPAAIVGVVAPAPAPAITLATNPAADPDGAMPVEPQASTPAKSGATTPNALAPTALAETSETPAKPQAIADATAAASAERPTPSDDPQRDAPLNAASPSESDEAFDPKPPAPADHKPEPGKAKSDHPPVARNPNAPLQPVAKPATDAAELQPNPTQHQSQAAEHASPIARAAGAEARSDLPATAAAPAQLNAATPNVPFLLSAATATPLPSLSPATALRVDAAADNRRAGRRPRGRDRVARAGGTAAFRHPARSARAWSHRCAARCRYRRQGHLASHRRARRNSRPPAPRRAPTRARAPARRPQHRGRPRIFAA